ncbi:attractin-like protein 1 isoform X2 [Tachypleus tridentatus]|uniref:attractin-like protein 1 isoform X2 n=1 Tax=Tachypleus tridentatus TaxID=6853 RepID=UPI003FD3AD79
MGNGLSMWQLSLWVIFRKRKIILNISRSFLLFFFTLLMCIETILAEGKCGDVECVHGSCRDGRCLCDPGWQGLSCQRCGGRVRLSSTSGIITDGAGNYSVNTQCTWLIESSKNVPIRLSLVSFATECSWDHLYIFDGSSVYSPLVAAFSGVYKTTHNSTELPEVVTLSGSAYLYFYSDNVYNMSGFTISINGCPRNCSGRGLCVDGQCTCWGHWSGSACNIPACSRSCSNGQCEIESDRCLCKAGYKGVHCNLAASEGGWEVVETIGITLVTALHQSVVYEDELWVFEGENFHTTVFQNIVKYNFHKNVWKTVDAASKKKPLARFGHSVVMFKGLIYLYGGRLKSGDMLNDFWSFDPVHQVWKEITKYKEDPNCTGHLCSPLAVVGHTATLVNDLMVVIFGYNFVLGYLNSVQEYNFLSLSWKTVKTKGAIVKGGFGHTSTYDKIGQLIYVYGGYHSQGPAGMVVDLLYAYNPFEHSWSQLASSGSYRYLHSGVFLNGMLLVFGGNTHNDTSFSTGDKCFSADFQAYDVHCDTWETLDNPVPEYLSTFSRFGHTANIYNDSMFVYGGFNGQLLSSLLKFSPGSCITSSNQGECLSSKLGRRCEWVKDTGSCQAQVHTPSRKSPRSYCRRKKVFYNYTALCEKMTSCPSCLANSYDCVWCGSLCSYKRCPDSLKITSNLESCEDAESSNCDKLHNCHACHTENHCGWQADNKCYTFVREMDNKTVKAVLSPDTRVKCELPCSSRTTCETCTQGSCMWCGNLETCLEANAYAALFPTAQCMEWTTHSHRCKGLQCSDIQTCKECLSNPRCGWCDDGSGSGIGTCMEGGARGPVEHWNDTVPHMNNSFCLKEYWYFSSCPDCQCNGHSFCKNETGVCDQPCAHLTEGKHCERCILGYYGNALNGGMCKQCSCNNQATVCHRETGKCYCTTKGITGDSCDMCAENYVGHPEDGGTCYYNLNSNFQYKFELSKPDNRYHHQINFRHEPMKIDVDVDFSISCSTPALFNITTASSFMPEQAMIENQECPEVEFKRRFSHNEHSFVGKNTTFYVYVYDISTPMVLKTGFSQYRQLDLLQFFITFSSCFLSLLIIAAILWKVKRKYDLYRRRQQLFVEMEQMASRAFGGTILELPELPQESIGIPAVNQVPPAPIALEPCIDGKAAILTLLVKTPTGDQEFTPEGQAGLAIASALVSLGQLNTSSNTTTRVIKDTKKVDLWKVDPDHTTCI